MVTVGQLGEHALIDKLVCMLDDDRTVVVGPGDDCAVVRPAADGPTDWVLTSDPVTCGIHFSENAKPAAIGHKAMGRMLSDIAAMGAQPAWAVLNLVAPASTETAVIEAIYRGVTALASRHGCAIVGGDVSEGPSLAIHVFGVGTLPRGEALLRSTARPGDSLFVTGQLGGSAFGHHLNFEPRVKEGCWLRNWATAMIDLSDGLAGDIRHITEMSHVGCDLNAPAIPVSTAAKRAEDGIPPLDHALHDGEDFELLFTVPEPRTQHFRREWHSAFPELPCTLVGRMTDQPGQVRCVIPGGGSVVLEKGGYTHFRENE